MRAMAEHWIEASVALELIGSNSALCARLHAGLIKSQARTIFVDNERRQETILPREFWAVDRYSHFVEDWAAGDFSAVVEHSELWVALGVRFDLSGVAEMLPFERRALVARQLSVSGNPRWLSAKESRRFAYEICGVNPSSAGDFILEQARLGFLAGRAVLAQGARGRLEENWIWEFREWDIPVWFWEDAPMEVHSSQDWELGKFAGPAKGARGAKWVTLSGVHFSSETVRALAGPAKVESVEARPDAPEIVTPPLAQAKLIDWWNRKADIKSNLTEEELLTLARAAHPNNFIARDRIRAMRGPTKRGPKPVPR